jgi:sugar phosphate isomerase/epimerase
VEPLEIGVCSWSLDEPDIRQAFDLVRSEFGLSVVQYGFMKTASPGANDGEVIDAARDFGIELSATFVAFAGEDYGSIDRIMQTGGLADGGAIDARMRFLAEAAESTARFGVKLLCLHVGYVPDDRGDPRYNMMLARTAAAADLLAKRRLTLCMESGRESPETLRRFLDDLGRDNVRINFDPGNLILYGVCEPVEAVSVLKDRIAHVHLKDATWSDAPGKSWGTEAPLGNGDAEIARVVSKLRAGGYRGPLVIECGTGPDRLAAIGDAVEYLSTLF